MERVYLLVEDATQQRLPCMLNPETLVQRRLAGVQPRRSATGRLTGSGLTDDPLLYTGGGYTELALDLLFDVALVDKPQKPENVRTLTQPLWELAENTTKGRYQGRPPLVRFLWGKEWNFPGVVVAVAERLDLFTAEGVPQRSWLRLRLVRSQAPEARVAVARPRLSAAALAGAIALAPQATNQQTPVVRAGGPERARPSPAAGLSVSEAVWTASDIVLSAIAATPAGKWVASAGQRLGELVAGLKNRLKERLKEWWETPSELRKAIKTGLDRLGRGLEALGSAAKERIVGAATEVAAQVQSAYFSMSRALEKATGPIKEKLQESLKPLVDGLKPVVRSLREATAVAGEAVRAQVHRIVAGVVRYVEAGLMKVGKRLEQATDSLSRRLEQVKDSLSEVQRKALDRIHSRLEQVKGSLAKVQRVANWVVTENIAPVLAAMADAAHLLWTAGRHAASRKLGETAAQMRAASEKIGQTAARMGVAFTNMVAAGEAARLAWGEAADTVVKPAVARLRHGLEMLRTGADGAGSLIEAAWADLKAGAEALPSSLEAITCLRDIIERELPDLENPERQEGARKRVSDALAEAEKVPGLIQVATRDALAVPTMQSMLDQARAPDAEPPAQIQAAWADVEAKIEALSAPDDPALLKPVAAARQAIQKELPALCKPDTMRDAAGRVSAKLEDLAAWLADAEEKVTRLVQRERLDQAAFRHYGDPAYWRVLARFNGISDPLHLDPDAVLRLPPAALASEGA